MNLTQIIKMFLSFWPVYLIFFIIAIVTFVFESKKTIDIKEVSPYEKRPFLFDSVSELNLYKILVELFGTEYHIFPQINYSHIIRTKDKYDRSDRNKIDKKSADFVLCDKEHVIPLLIIELDGDSHKLAKTQVRDQSINKIMKDINFPILHLKVDNLDKEFIKMEIIRKLTNK